MLLGIDKIAKNWSNMLTQERVWVARYKLIFWHKLIFLGLLFSSILTWFFDGPFPRGKGENVSEKLFVLGIYYKSLFTQSSTMYFYKVLNFALTRFFGQTINIRGPQKISSILRGTHQSFTNFKNML